MPLAQLYNTPLNPEQEAVFNFAHADHHRRMIQAAFVRFHITLPEFVLDPLNAQSVDVILQHQTMHNAIDALYGISGFDLTDVNWQDEQQRAGWIWLNAQLHQQEALKTGVF